MTVRAWLKTIIYDERDFILSITNFPFISSNIPTTHVYGSYISQLIQYSRTCVCYQTFCDRGLLLTRNLQNQWFIVVKYYSRHNDLVNSNGISYVTYDHGYVPFVTWSWICSVCPSNNPVLLSSFMNYYGIWLIIEFLTWVRHRLSLIEQSSSPLFVSGVRVVRSLVVCLVFCRPLLSFVFVFPSLIYGSRYCKLLLYTCRNNKRYMAGVCRNNKRYMAGVSSCLT